jgi:ATP-dependent DNA helicase RecG
VPAAEPEQWLRKQQLIRDDRPTVAALLLFAEEPQAVLPKRSGMKIYRYTTKDAVGTRETLAFTPLTVEGPLYSQIRAAVQKTREVIQETRRLGEVTLEEVQYPPEAIHEIITNAALHRDYSIPDDVHIRIFDNRIEVDSPGRLPGHITEQNILHERFARNAALVRLLNKFPDPPNQDVGEGLNTAFAAMTKLGLKEPVIEQRENSVLVSIRHESLASPEEVILEYLESHSSIRNKVAREICHISGDYVIKEIFNRLVARGLIQRVEGTRTATTAYEQGPKFENWRRRDDAPDTSN